MTTSQPRYQDPGPELDSATGGSAPPPPPPPAPPRYGEFPSQLVPPPVFGRLPRSFPSPEPTRIAASTVAGAGQPAPGQHHVQGARAVPPGGSPDVGAPPSAEFGSRAISCLIDYVAPVIVLNLLLSIGVATGSLASRPVLMVVGYLGLLGFGIGNSGYLQGTTGRSLGRRVARTMLVTIETGRPPGFGRAVVRQLCHGVEFGIGFLWPLWDSKRQTFADKIVGTVVIRPAGQPKIAATTDQ